MYIIKSKDYNEVLLIDNIFTFMMSGVKAELNELVSGLIIQAVDLGDKKSLAEAKKLHDTIEKMPENEVDQGTISMIISTGISISDSLKKARFCKQAKDLANLLTRLSKAAKKLNDTQTTYNTMKLYNSLVKIQDKDITFDDLSSRSTAGNTLLLTMLNNRKTSHRYT